MKSLLLIATLLSSTVSFADTSLESAIHREITEGKILAAMEANNYFEESDIQREITEGKILAAMEQTIIVKREEIVEQLLLVDIMLNALNRQDKVAAKKLIQKVNVITAKLDKVSDEVEDSTIGALDQIKMDLDKLISEIEETGVNY